jgi:hypothetical protein
MQSLRRAVVLFFVAAMFGSSVGQSMPTASADHIAIPEIAALFGPEACDGVALLVDVT